MKSRGCGRGERKGHQAGEGVSRQRGSPVGAEVGFAARYPFITAPPAAAMPSLPLRAPLPQNALMLAAFVSVSRHNGADAAVDSNGNTGYSSA